MLKWNPSDYQRINTYNLYISMKRYLIYSKGLNKFITDNKGMSKRQEDAALYEKIGSAMSEASSLNQEVENLEYYFKVYPIEIND